MAEATRGLPLGARLRPRRSPLDRYQAYVKTVQGWGKLRRFLFSKCRPGRVKQALELRRGECVRCGSCCSIMFRCPHLREGNHCGIYGKRYEQCGHFPIDERDLRYLEHVCGYHFVRRDSRDN